MGPIPTSSVEETTEGAGTILLKSCDFVPHIARIAKLMASKVGNESSCIWCMTGKRKVEVFSKHA